MAVGEQGRPKGTKIVHELKTELLELRRSQAETQKMLESIFTAMSEASRREPRAGQEEPVEPSDVEITKASDYLPPNFKAIYELVEAARASSDEASTQTEHILGELSVRVDNHAQSINLQLSEIEDRVNELAEAATLAQEASDAAQQAPVPAPDRPPRHPGRREEGRRAPHPHLDDFPPSDEPQGPDISEELEEWTKKIASLAMNISDRVEALSKELEEAQAPRPAEPEGDATTGDEARPTVPAILAPALAALAAALSAATLVATLMG